VGFWYEVYRSDIIFEVGSRCVNATYTPNADGTVGVWNQAVNFMGDYTSIRGSAKVKNASEPAAFIVTFDNPGKISFFFHDDFNNCLMFFSSKR
jgi:lipocalin